MLDLLFKKNLWWKDFCLITSFFCIFTNPIDAPNSCIYELWMVVQLVLFYGSCLFVYLLLSFCFFFQTKYLEFQTRKNTDSPLHKKTVTMFSVLMLNTLFIWYKWFIWRDRDIMMTQQLTLWLLGLRWCTYWHCSQLLRFFWTVEFYKQARTKIEIWIITKWLSI